MPWIHGERERDATACMRRHQASALVPVPSRAMLFERDRHASACMRGYQAFALSPVNSDIIW